MADLTETLGLRLRVDGAVETSNGILLGADSIGKLGAQADAAGRKVTDLGGASQGAVAPVRNVGRGAAEAEAGVARMGKTAKETAAAMRLLPAQITDIVVSLASGQPAYLVAIQQGGQLKDSFGGIGPAMRAVLGYFSPMTLGLLGVGAAAGVAALAFSQGEAEALGYRQAIVMTGNAAGVTTDQVSDMAAALDEVVGTQRAAADAMTQLLQSAQVSGAQLAQFAEVALRMERVTGQAVDKTVQTFAELAKDPVGASAKLNEQVNYLTRDIWNQIKALQEQKRYSEAAAVAQQAYADVVSGRLKQLEGNLGTLEKAWQFVKTAAAEGWDALLGLGREKTAGQQIQALQTSILSLQEEITDAYVRGDAARARSLEAVLKRKQEEQSLLQSDVRTSKAAADRQATEASALRDTIKAEQDKGKAKRETQSLYERFMAQADERLNAERQELELGRELTAGQRYLAGIKRELSDIERKDGPVKAAAARARAEEVAQLLDLNQWNAAAADSYQRLLQAREQQEKALQNSVAGLQREVEALQWEASAAGGTAEWLAVLERARVSSAIALRQERLAKIEGQEFYAKEAELLRREIELLERKAELQGAKIVRAAQARERDENAKRTDELAAALEDGIWTGFRNGSKAADWFLEQLKREFSRTVLQPMIRPIADSGSDLLSNIVKGALRFFNGGSNIPAGSTVPPPREYAWGGNAEPGSTILVGEKGPEVLRLGKQRGTVQPNPRMGTGGGGGGGVQLTYAPSIQIDARTDQAQVMQLVQRGLRAGQAELLEMMERKMA